MQVAGETCEIKLYEVRALVISFWSLDNAQAGSRTVIAGSHTVGFQGLENMIGAVRSVAIGPSLMFERLVAMDEETHTMYACLSRMAPPFPRLHLKLSGSDTCVPRTACSE